MIRYGKYTECSRGSFCIICIFYFHVPHIGVHKYSRLILIIDLLYTAIAHEVLPVSLVDSVTAKVDDETKRPCIQYIHVVYIMLYTCLLYTSPSPRDLSTSRMPSSA